MFKTKNGKEYFSRLQSRLRHVGCYEKCDRVDNQSNLLVLAELYSKYSAKHKTNSS